MPGYSRILAPCAVLDLDPKLILPTLLCPPFLLLSPSVALLIYVNEAIAGALSGFTPLCWFLLISRLTSSFGPCPPPSASGSLWMHQDLPFREFHTTVTMPIDWGEIAAITGSVVALGGSGYTWVRARPSLPLPFPFLSSSSLSFLLSFFPSSLLSSSLPFFPSSSLPFLFFLSSVPSSSPPLPFLPSPFLLSSSSLLPSSFPHPVPLPPSPLPQYQYQRSEKHEARSSYVQSVLRQLQQAFKSPLPRVQLDILPRPNEAKLKRILDQSPSSAFLLVGPSKSGKSTYIHHLVNNRSAVVYLAGRKIVSDAVIPESFAMAFGCVGTRKGSSLCASSSPLML